jgi:hypothetical protein
MSESSVSEREVELIDKAEGTDKQNRISWDAIERISKTLSIAAIPVVLAVGGWIIQQRLQDQTVSRDYVQLAVSILKEPEGSTIKPEVRAWAVKLLNDNSPTKFTPEVAEQLQTGQSQLPASFNISSSSDTPAAATSTSVDPRQEAVSWEQKGFDFIISKNAEAALMAFTNAEKLWPNYHNVAEIRKLLVTNQAVLVAATKESKEEPWAGFYRTLLSKYSWGMSPDIKDKIKEMLNS